MKKKRLVLHCNLAISKKAIKLYDIEMVIKKMFKRGNTETTFFKMYHKVSKNPRVMCQTDLIVLPPLRKKGFK